MDTQYYGENNNENLLAAILVTAVLLGDLVPGHKVIEEAEDLSRLHSHSSHQVTASRQQHTQVPTVTYPAHKKKSLVEFHYAGLQWSESLLSILKMKAKEKN